MSTIVVSSSCVLGLLPPQRVLLSWKAVTDDWEFWRPVSALFLANMSQLSGLMDVYALYSFSKGLEEGKFFLNISDYCFYLFLIIPLIQLCSVVMPPGSLLLPLVSALTYTWSRKNRYNQVLVYFVKIQGEYLPLAMLIFTFLLFGKEPFFSALSGFSAAYFYQCLESRTLGPVYAWICSTLGVDVTRTGQTQRVGTIHTINHTDEGPLKAPYWFVRIVEFFTARQRVKGHEKAQGRRIGGFGNMNSNQPQGSSGKSSGFSYTSAFRGTGARLGSE